MMTFETCFAFLKMPFWVWIAIAVTYLPGVSATPEHAAFPDITFKAFSAFIESNFSSKISLATVLLLLFTMTDNPDLLSLHARQQYPMCPGERATKVSAWIKSLARGIFDRLGEETAERLFKKKENSSDKTKDLGIKLDELAKTLNLTPYNRHGKFTGKLKPVSHKEIQPVLMICPNSINCEDLKCEPRALLQSTEIKDISQVTLIKGTTIHEKAIVLGGSCTKCKTIYYADHERVLEPGGFDPSRVYLNSAKYLKVGQNTWVDRTFAGAILNGMYSFHASASAFTEFWNNSYGNIPGQGTAKITRRQVWQGFIQESIRMVASDSKTNLQITDGLSISEKTKEAFANLGNNGVVSISKDHACPECSQPYKGISDLRPNVSSAAVAGVDENRNVPAFIGDDGNPVMEENVQRQPQDPMSVDSTPEAMPITMDIVDGIVMGPMVCDFF